MKKAGSNLLFLAIGAAIGAAVGYVAASDKKEEWFKEVGNLVDKVKGNVKTAACKSKEGLESAVDAGKQSLKAAIDRSKGNTEEQENSI